MTLTAALAISGALVLFAYWRTTTADDAPAAAPVESAPAPIDKPFVTFVDPSRGPKDAEATVIAFGDHACPYCRSVHEALERLAAERSGRVRVVWKSAPSALHPGSDTAAEAALCADRQGRFWDFHAALYENPGLFDQASLALIASDLDLDTTAFNACLMDGATRPLVERTIDEARALGLTAIPTLFIGDRRYEGAMSYEQLLEATGL